MFGPPEVITGRLMSGAGAAPMTAASAEFTAAATAYEVAIDRLIATLTQLAGTWMGPSATAMQAAVTQHIVALRLFQAQVMVAAARTGAQAASFAEAYATMAQMPEIVENRVTTATLVATNFLGMNTIPIGVREGQYGEMWIQDVMVQTNYLAQTIANTTFEPFLPLPPITTGVPPLPPTITQAVNAAQTAGDHVQMAAIQAQAAASTMAAHAGMAGATGLGAGQRADGAFRKAEAQQSMDRYRENQNQQNPAQQLMQAPQQAASMAQQGIQAPQQAMQQVQQVGSQATQQFGSQISNLMGQVSPEHQLDNPGFFDTHPSSTTLDRLSGSTGGAGAMTAALRVGSLSGLSGGASGIRFPSGWEGAPVPAAIPPPPATAGTAGSAMPLRGGMGAMPLAAARAARDQSTPTKRPLTELTPLWGYVPPEPETVSAGELAAGATGDRHGKDEEEKEGVVVP